MATRGSNRSSAPGNNSSLILGILVGMVLGLLVAGGVAWHISSRPKAFQDKEPHEKASAEPAAPATAPPKAATPATRPANAAPASGVGDGKPRFEFYTILTDKAGTAPKGTGHAPATTHSSTAPAQKEAVKTSPVTGTSYFLQAGSFSSSDEADKLKARLALAGMEASIQSANVAGKGTYYRVRLGPYRSADEINKANSALKQNGINDAAQVRAQ